MSDSFEKAVSYLLDRIRVAGEVNVPTANGAAVLAEARRELDQITAELWRYLDGLDRKDDQILREKIASLMMLAFDIANYGPVSESSYATSRKWKSEDDAAKARAGKKSVGKTAAIETAIGKHVPSGWDGKTPNLTSLGDAIAAEVGQIGHRLDPKSARDVLRERFGLMKRIRASARDPI